MGVYQNIIKMCEYKDNEDFKGYSDYITSIPLSEWYELKSFTESLLELSSSEINNIEKLKDIRYKVYKTTFQETRELDILTKEEIGRRELRKKELYYEMDGIQRELNDLNTSIEIFKADMKK